ncbi:MAG TPA: M23 family metallopeptidase, partial [Candidatus Dojkabacteria bacterium]|nr:M23 family metallopeptidase [Candidatus Dojkabacteria bacterium]
NEVVLGQTDYKVPKDGGDGGGGTPFNGEPLPDGVSCLMGSSQQYDCTQGAGAPFSHGALPNAIDIGYVGYFYAPSFCGDGNCEIIENGDYPYCNGYAGGQVVFDAQYGGHTYRFKLVHVQMDPGLSVGDELGAGQIVARIMDHSETGSACSTGTHLHLEMWYDGAAVDPISIMSEDSGGGGFGCSFDSCGN